MSEQFAQEFYDKSVREQKEKIVVTICDDPIYVFALAISKDIVKNITTKISCAYGIPLGGHVYDSLTDAYYYECVDYLPLGSVPVSAVLRLKDSNIWEMRVPVTDNVIKKFFSTDQKKDFKNFRNKFKPEFFDIQFVQMISANPDSRARK